MKGFDNLNRVDCYLVISVMAQVTFLLKGNAVIASIWTGVFMLISTIQFYHSK